jgi:hypothetical protein
VSREATERRREQVRSLIMAGSQRLLEMGSAAEAADQYRLAEMAAMCFAEALDVDPSDPKATYGLEQSMQAVEVLKAAEVATVEAVELAAMAARAAAAERIAMEEQQKLQMGFNLARKVAARTITRQVRPARRVLLTGAASELGTTLRHHWRHGSALDAGLWKRIAPPGAEAWRPYDAPYSLLLVDSTPIADDRQVILRGPSLVAARAMQTDGL